MHTKTRNGRAMLYRSRYVRKGVTDNTHGYSTQEFVGSLPLNAQPMPAEFATKLTPEEMEYVEKRVLVPARHAADGARREEEAARNAELARERDPRWRIEEALRLLTEAEALVAFPGTRMDSTRVKSLYRTLDALAATANVRQDPLDAVIAAVKSATEEVKSGRYGTSSSRKVRDTDVYKNWQRIREVVDSGSDSLLEALQARKWVTVRGQ